MKVVEDTVELPTGERIQYIREKPTDNASVAIIAINDNNELLLQQEYSYPPNEIMYQLPGDATNANEDIIEAANRELSEESGYIGKKCEVIGSFYLNNRRSDRKQYVVVCRELQEQKGRTDSEEFIDNEWMSVDILQSKVRKGEIVNINLLAALQLYGASILDT